MIDILVDAGVGDLVGTSVGKHEGLLVKRTFCMTVGKVVHRSERLQVGDTVGVRVKDAVAKLDGAGISAAGGGNEGKLVRVLQGALVGETQEIMVGASVCVRGGFGSGTLDGEIVGDLAGNCE